MLTNKVEEIANGKFIGYKKVFVDGDSFQFREFFRDSKIDELVKEYNVLKQIIKKSNPTFQLLKEGLIIRHFTLYGFESLQFAKKSDISTFITGVYNLYDVKVQSEGVSYLSKIMSLFNEDEIKKVEMRLNAVAV